MYTISKVDRPISFFVSASLTGLLLLCFVASAVAVYEDNLKQVMNLPRPYKKKIVQTEHETYSYAEPRQPIYEQDTDLTAAASDPTKNGLKDSATKLSELYGVIRSVALPQSDTYSQGLVMLIPGKVLNYYDYFPGPLYESSMENPDHTGKQVSIPVRVMENMFALADVVPGTDPLRGAETGESMALIYKNLLDWMQIKGFNEKTQEEKKHIMLAVQYLAHQVPDPLNVSVNVTRFHLYRRAEDAYNARRLEMEDIIAQNRFTLRQDDYERWFQRNYPSLNARVEAAYTEWLVFGEKEIVELYKTYLDTQAPGIDLEEARMALRASGVIALDRSRTIYPVSFVPSNWYRYLTNVSKVDEASRIKAMSGDQIRIQIGRLEARRAVLVALMSAPAEPAAKNTLDEVKKNMTDANATLSAAVKTAERDRQNCLAKRGCHIAPDTKGSTSCDSFTKSSERTSDIVDQNSEIYSCSEALNSQLNPESQKPNIDAAIKSIDAAIAEYKNALTTSTVTLSQLADNAAHDKEQLDSSWLRFSFDSAASSQQTEYSSSYSSYSASASARRASWWSASSSYSSYRSQSSQQHFSSEMNKANVNVQGELLRVTIQRPWFRPSLFRSAQYLIADSVLVSPGDHLTEKEFVGETMNRTKYLLPHYATGLLLSRNVSIEFRISDSSVVYHAIQQSTSSFSSGFSVGGFWGSRSSSAYSSSSSSGSNSYSSKVESTENGLRVTIPGVSIIGYYTQNVPLFPRP